MRTIYPSWRDQQAQQTYPFADSGTPVSFDGNELPIGFLVDALIHPINGVGGYYLDSITVGVSSIALVVRDKNGAIAATGIWKADSPDTTVIQLYDLNRERAGVLVGNADAISEVWNTWTKGTHELQSTGAEFVPSTWAYANRATIAADIDGTEVSANGDLYVVAEDGVRFKCATGTDGRTIVAVHAVGDPLAARKACGEDFVVPRFVKELVFQHNARTINCTPSAIGGIHLVINNLNVEEPALRLFNSPAQIAIGLAAKTTWR